MRKIKFLLSTLVLLMVAALPVNADTWTVVGDEALMGTGYNWNTGSDLDTSHDMTQVGETSIWKITLQNVTLTGGTTYKYKVVANHSWDVSYGNPNNSDDSYNRYLYCSTSGVYDITFWFDAEDHGVTSSLDNFSVTGNIWDNWVSDKDLVQDENNPLVYTLVIPEFDAEVNTYEYKFRDNKKWGIYDFPTSGNYTWDCTQAGKYKLTFTANIATNTFSLDAEKLPDYIVDFNTAITTSDHAFQVASNWRHIVDYLEYDNYGPEYSYVTYGYVTDGGKDNTGALRAYSQHLTASYSSESKDAYDLLVTPLISGTINIDVKAMNYSDASLEIYALTNNGTQKGDLIKSVTYSELSTSDYTTISFNLASEQRIGIRMNRVYIDNFTAESVTIIPEAKITIASAVPTATTGTIYWEQQPNGKVLVSYTVTVTNNGEVDLTQGMDGYSVSIINGSTGDVYSTVAVPQDLAVGETSDEFVVSAEVETSLWPNIYTYIQMNLKENLFGQVVERAQSTYIAYEPKLVFRTAGSSSTSNISPAEAWGTITESTTKNYEIFNKGTAPLIVNSIAIPEGFTTDPAGTDVVLFRTSGYNADGAVWYAWTWNDGEDGAWVPEAEGKFTGLRQKVNFIRMNPAGAPDWSKEWNRTGDLTVEPGKTYVIDSWGDTYEEKNYVNGHWAAAVVAKGATKAINITNDASVAGTFVGDLVIKYLDKDAAEQTYTLGFSATVIGANTWTADFNNSTSTVVYPAGSVAEAGITSDWDNKTSEGKYNIYLKGNNAESYKTAKNKFITPKLHATAGEKLAFDVKAGYSSTDAYFVKVYVSTDRKNWGEPVETYVYSNTGSSFTTKTITFAEEGDYYVAFALYGSGSGIDNLVGLEKVDVAHDLYIKSVDWPDASVKTGTSLTKPSVDIIPLTTETADAYTVKYVCGETVLAEGTPVALTASANTSKTFSFSWTPEVVSTTVYENTKVVFDFGSGVTFETDPFTLTVTNEPIFHFVKTLPTSKWNEPTDYKTPITFGKTYTADAQTFYVYNWGTAPLTVKSISVPEGFTVTPTEQFNVVAFDENNFSASSRDVTITFSAASPGTYSGNMVITYVDGNGDDQTFELGVSGTKPDPTKWYANFDDQQWPAGSAYQSNVSISYINTGNYGLMSSSDTKNIFITPKLAAAAGDVLQFDASTRNNYYDGTVKVYISNNRENLDDPVKEIELSKVDNVTMSTYEYQFAAAGDYYVAFALEEARVDEIYGLTPVAVDHDLMIASSNIPTEAMQNVAKNASVNVVNLGLGIANEEAGSYEVNLYIGGEKTATVTDTPALPMTHQLSAAKQITVPMQSPKAGTFPVYIEVKAGEYSIATKPVNVTFAEEAPSTGDIEIGTKGSSSNYTYAIIDFQNFEQARTSDILYTATQLSKFGLKSGDMIQKLTFKGTVSYVKDMGQSALTSWVGLSTGDITYGSPDKTSMTKVPVYEAGEMVFTSGENLITINLPAPIVWDGNSDLRIYFEGGGDNKWITMNFYYDTNYQNMKWSNNSSMKYNPILYVGLVPEEPKTYYGTVKDNLNNPIENATVTLVSDDVDNIQYSGITDKNGAYSINVVQDSRTYDATATAYGYDDATDADISFAADVNNNFVLTRKDNVSVTVTSAEWATITTPATYAVSFDDNTEVYIATANNDKSITLEKISDAPAMTPIVIHASAGAYTMTQKATAASDVTANILESAKGNEVGDGNGNYYVLGMTSTGVGFGKLASGVTLAKGKAYIPGTTLANASDFLTFVIGDEDETTTINAVDAAGMDDDTPVYNIAGQKVGKDYKGVVIVNGRKVVRK